MLLRFLILHTHYITTGYNYRGDVSIDDVKFVDCAPPINSNGGGCLPSQFMCNNGYCIEGSQLCDTQQDCMNNEDETVSLLYVPVFTYNKHLSFLLV